MPGSGFGRVFLFLRAGLLTALLDPVLIVPLRLRGYLYGVFYRRRRGVCEIFAVSGFGVVLLETGHGGLSCSLVLCVAEWKMKKDDKKELQ